LRFLKITFVGWRLLASDDSWRIRVSVRGGPISPALFRSAPTARLILDDTAQMNTFTNTLKTWTLLAALGGLLVLVGRLVGGPTGMVMALVFAVALNGFVYWKSDTLALKANGARELGLGEAPRLRAIVTELSRRAGIPVPKLYIVDRPEPNAFATGRDPEHAAVAVTTGILESMDERQLTGVLAHELSHVKNRDTLVGTIAATIGGAISFIAQMLQFQMLFGGGSDEEGNGGAGMVGALAAMILAPIAALIIQMAVSRGREYLADSSGAALTGDPEGLAQALEQLEAASQRQGLFGPFGRRRVPDPAHQPAANPAFAHLFFVNPLTGRQVASLFSTHPPIPDRVARLRRMSLRRAA
jgi:heat shock protein HtpX